MKNQSSSEENSITEFKDLFSRTPEDIGRITRTQQRIDTGNHTSIRQHPNKLPFAKQEEVQELLREMQQNAVIEPLTSPWTSPILEFGRKVVLKSYLETTVN